MTREQAVDKLYTYNANVTSVYDGDTITIDVDLGFGVWLRGQKMRLLYVDTPEIRGKERFEGLRVRDIVREMILYKDIIVRTHQDQKGKYGRWLCEVIIGDVNLNQFLLEHKLAKRYE